jgi:voltage-gated potassium channel
MSLARMRFSILLGTLLFLALLSPLLEELGFVRAQILLNLSIILILLSGAYAVANTKKAFLIILLLALCPVILMFLKPYVPWSVQLAVEISVAIFFVMIAAMLLRTVLKNERVTWEKISAALCFYFLIGIIWAFFYYMIYNFHPESIRLAGNATDFSPFVYYSMITLTTVGYGDITPVSPFTRSLAFVEAIIGQFYLAVLVARLVGLHIVHASDEKNH